MTAGRDTHQDEFAELLQVLLEGSDEVTNVMTFQEDGMFTSDAGLTVRTEDGTVFHVIVAQRAPADGQDW